MFLFRVAFWFPSPKNAVEQQHALVTFRQHFAERYSDELFRGLRSSVRRPADQMGLLHDLHRRENKRLLEARPDDLDSHR
jgi:hypothetical protein